MTDLQALGFVDCNEPTLSFWDIYKAVAKILDVLRDYLDEDELQEVCQECYRRLES